MTSSSSSSSGSGGSGGIGGSGGSGGAPIDCGPAASGAAPPLQLTQVASGLSRPVFVTAAPGDDSRLFIVEQRGLIKILMNGAVQATPFLDIDALIPNPSGASEFGLLGLAFHPEYATNRRFFVFFHRASNGHSVVVEYLRSMNNPNVADPNPVQTLLSIAGASNQHYGGMMAFGPDGYLYVSSGDRGTPATGQNINDPRSKMLRIDVNNFPMPPPGNLPGGDPYVWDYGLRNAWRFSFDRCAGNLYIGDVGGVYEEVNVETAGAGHHNYGWPVVDTGTSCAGATCPVWAINHTQGDCSMIAGYVYRGTAIPNMNGRFLHGDWCTNRIRSFVWQGGSTIATEEDLSANLNSTGTIQALSSFGQDNAGNLYVVDLVGAIYRIDAE